MANPNSSIYVIEKGFFDLGIKQTFTKWLNPDATTADLGDEMQAYYDNERKVWVLPGQDPEELAKPIGPPPTALASTAPSASDDKDSKTSQSADPLAAMMAPPQRGPSALSRSRGSTPSIRPSPASMPIMFPPGMTMPGPGASTFSVFTPPAANLEQSDDSAKQIPSAE